MSLARPPFKASISETLSGRERKADETERDPAANSAMPDHLSVSVMLHCPRMIGWTWTFGKGKFVGVDRNVKL